MVFLKKLEAKSIQEKETLTLEVELSKPSTEVKWMKNGSLLRPSADMELKAEGTKHSLVIKSAVSTDRGYYSCETLHDKTQAKVAVESKSGSELSLQKSKCFASDCSSRRVSASAMPEGVGAFANPCPGSSSPK